MEQEFTCSTEVGLLAVWDVNSLSFVNDNNYGDNFVEDKAIAGLMNKGFLACWGTGGDGTYKVKVRINPDLVLSSEEMEMVEMKAENLKLAVTSERVQIGSPEFIGNPQGESEAAEYNVRGLKLGLYAVDVYFLYDSKAIEYEDTLTASEIDKFLENNPNFDHNGFVVIIKSVGQKHQFGDVAAPPQLG